MAKLAMEPGPRRLGSPTAHGISSDLSGAPLASGPRSRAALGIDASILSGYPHADECDRFARLV